MRQSVRHSAYNDYIALDFLDDKDNIQSTPFYISNDKEVEVHWIASSNEQSDHRQDDWRERYLFKMEDGKLYCKWLNGPQADRDAFSEVVPKELVGWKFEFAHKIINKK